MDAIQRTLIKAGRKDLAREYYRKITGGKIKWEKYAPEKMSKAMEDVDGIQDSVETIYDKNLDKDFKEKLVSLSKRALKSGRTGDLKNFIEQTLEIEKVKRSLLRILDIVR